MDIISEYDFGVQRKLLRKQRNLVDFLLKRLCKHLCRPELTDNHSTCFQPDFVIEMKAFASFNVYLPITLGQEAAVYIHKHSPCNVLIQTMGAVSELVKDFTNEEGFLNADKAKTILNVHLGKVLHENVHGEDYRKTQRLERFSGLYLNYTNVLQINSEYGVISVEIHPVIKVQKSLKNWFLRDYICSPSYFVANCSVTDKYPSPGLIWSLSFSDREREVELTYQRLFLMTVIFIEKFKLKVIKREEVLQVLYILESNEHVATKSFFDVLTILHSRLSSRCLYNYVVKEPFNMVQFENEVELIKVLNVIQQYKKCLRRYYCYETTSF